MVEGEDGSRSGAATEVIGRCAGRPSWARRFLFLLALASLSCGHLHAGAPPPGATVGEVTSPVAPDDERRWRSLRALRAEVATGQERLAAWQADFETRRRSLSLDRSTPRRAPEPAFEQDLHGLVRQMMALQLEAGALSRARQALAQRRAALAIAEQRLRRREPAPVPPDGARP